MTRIGTLAQNQSILAELTKTNERMYKTQVQISTGKVAQQYRDMPSQTGVLLSAKRVETRTEEYKTAGTQLNNTLDQQNVILEQVASTGQDLRQSILDNVSTGSGAALMEQVQSAFRNALSALNTQSDGKYMFAGSRTDTKPVTATALSDLSATPSVSTLFTNDQQRQSVEIEQGHALDYNFFADEVGTGLMDSLKRIADFNAGPNGPFSGTLTDTQRDFLTTEANKLVTVTQDLNGLVARNGQFSNEVDDAMQRHDQTTTYVKGFISDVEDVDMAQAVTNLNQDQVVTEATAKLLTGLQKMSLLDFI